MDAESRAGSPSRPWWLLQLLVLVAGLAAAALLSRAAVSRFWEFSAAMAPDRFPWGRVTEQGARTFEEVMGFLILALLICPVANGVLLPALRRKTE